MIEKENNTAFKLIGVLFALYLFLVGINGLSLGIKHLGGDFAKTVINTTSNPFIALFIGILATALFQSSSTTTSLIVGMVSGGGLSLSGAIPMIMGANIGTTVTALLAAITGTVAALIAAISHLLFNIFGIIIIYGLPFLRVIPLKFAERIADYSIKNKLTPIVYLLIVFVAIPLSIILLGR